MFAKLEQHIVFNDAVRQLGNDVESTPYYGAFFIWRAQLRNCKNSPTRITWVINQAHCGAADKISRTLNTGNLLRELKETQHHAP